MASSTTTSPNLLRCFWCPVIKRRKDLLQCSRCRTAMYCSVECQRKAWKDGHKQMCRPNDAYTSHLRPGQSSGKEPPRGDPKWIPWARLKKEKAWNKWLDLWDTVLYTASVSGMDMQNHPGRNARDCPVIIVRERDALSGEEPPGRTFYVHDAFIRSIPALEAFSDALVITKNRDFDLSRRVFAAIILQSPALTDPLTAVPLSLDPTSPLTQSPAMHRRELEKKWAQHPEYVKDWEGLTDPDAGDGSGGYFMSCTRVTSWTYTPVQPVPGTGSARGAVPTLFAPIGGSLGQTHDLALIWVDALRATVNDGGMTRVRESSDDHHSKDTTTVLAAIMAAMHIDPSTIGEQTLRAMSGFDNMSDARDPYSISHFFANAAKVAILEMEYQDRMLQRVDAV